MTVIAATNVEALVIFSIVLSITLVITYWASKRMTGAEAFWAAGRSISGVQNGLAISGDYLSAASFLGIAGLIFIFGFDGFLYSVGFLVAFLTVMFLLAERMRNAGKYTIADVLSFRLRERPARTAAALGTLTVAAFYLIAQMVGAGVLIQALVGIDFSIAVLITGVVMLCYVIFGGMLATTWVQIIKAVLLMTGILVMSVFVLERVGFNPIELFNRAEANVTDESTSRSGRARSWPARSTPSRWASRSCWGPQGCRTSSCASSRCPTPRRPAHRSSGRCSSSAASTC
jgi:cation/acetate symporter